MKKHPILTSVLVSVPVAILFVVVVKLSGYDAPTEIIGGIAGVVAGILGSYIYKKLKVQQQHNTQS
ncbi:MAG: hypothetical protein JNL36_10115 [Candidatus Kapabacteria bacterium]|nr:hypothetical protein [Candidatus Kapabacteria bacterium]